MSKHGPTVVHGWSLYAHPLFLEEIQTLVDQVDRLKKRDPRNYHKKNPSKRLAAISRLIFEDIPRDPGRPEYRLGNTLGSGYRHWFRAKFFQQYRLFFRFHSASKTIVYAWVNDEKTKRAYSSRSDAYLVFEKMLLKGNPPDDWQQLLNSAENLVTIHE